MTELKLTELPTGHHHLDAKLSKGHQPLCPRCAPPSLPLLRERHCHHHPRGQNPWQPFPLESTFSLSPTGLSLGPVLVLLALRNIPWPSPAWLPGTAPTDFFSCSLAQNGLPAHSARSEALEVLLWALAAPPLWPSHPHPPSASPCVWLLPGAAKISLQD